MIKEFSKTGERLLALGLGTHGHGHAFGGIKKEESHDVLRRLEKCVPEGKKVLIDTAPRYGRGLVEGWLGEYLSECKSPFLIATKGGRHITPDRDNQKEWSIDFLRFDIEASLKRLGIDKIFLYQLHNPDIEIINDGRVFEILEGFRDEGLIDWYGVSINKPDEGSAAIDVCKSNGFGGLVALQVIYSILNKRGFAGLSDKAKTENIAIITREVILRGFLAGKYSSESDFSRAPSAVTKIINLYGEQELHRCVEKVKSLIVHSGLTLAQASIRFSIQNPDVTVTLAGINRAKYFEEDWSSLELGLSSEVMDILNRIDDIREK